MNSDPKPNPLRPSKLVLLTLPGAAMWSLPVGYWLQSRFAPNLRLLPLHDGRLVFVGIFLLVVVAFCSFRGMIECVGKGDGPSLKRVLLGALNVASFFVSFGVILLGLVALVDYRTR